MFQLTGKVAWVKITEEHYEVLLKELKTLPSFHGKCGRTILCEQMKDIQTGAITWKPLRTIEEARVEL